jgi:hypothetical protein
MEGINFSMVLSGASLISILGIGAKLWIANRPQQMGPQPFEVKQSVSHTPTVQCDERHLAIKSDTSNLFSRMSAAEQRIAAVEASHAAQQDQLKSMDAKLDKLLSRR